ncbi:hypothetical protein SAMN02745132_02748 [Enterovibrio nigricans DSM 22720]|uniref:Uncharacterized protein n=1 Tax=Enterovibrio nigricans DSM 22720 TaxID=1121868 RepID=A0A1T4UXL9_9GAMM|nr:hypothetical protein SAMN02745132_02748 [Enterovibrio nigricans DSM 22720]
MNVNLDGRLLADVRASDRSETQRHRKRYTNLPSRVSLTLEGKQDKISAQQREWQ